MRVRAHLRQACLYIVACGSIVLGLTACRKESRPAGQLPNKQRPTTRAVSRYVRPQDRPRAGVVVFVHGVGSDGTSAWTNTRSGTFWPGLLVKDLTFDDYDIFVYEYASPQLHQQVLTAPLIDELAEEMRREFADKKVLEHDEIVFLMHSMGGLVTRSYITRYREDLAGKVRFLFFLATPTTGGHFTHLADLVSRNPQYGLMKPLRRENYLGASQRDWLAARQKIPSYCAYEIQPFPAVGVIVDQDSALALCDQPAEPINENHIGIAKPDGPEHASYKAFRNAFRQRANTSAGMTVPDNATLRWVITEIAGQDGYTAVFTGCPETLLASKLRRAELRAGNIAAMIERLPQYLKAPTNTRFRVRKDAQNGHYEIACL